MPIYEYLCGGCRSKFRKLVGMTAESSALACPKCKSTEVNRLISRFARVRSEDDALEALEDEMESLGDSDDPRTVRRLMKDMGSALDEDFDDDIEAALAPETESSSD